MFIFRKGIMTDNSDSRHTDDQEKGEQVYPPHLEPLFWGTGDMLVWKTERLLSSIDQKQLFKTAWAKEILSDDELNHVSDTVFRPVFDELSTLIIGEQLIDARGFYGYFPVITDKNEVLVLDPSDFHTPLFSLAFTFSQRTLADFFRPEGDVIVFAAVSSGDGINTLRKRFAEDDKKDFYCRSLAHYLADELAQRIAVEIRRGLGIDDREGKIVQFDLTDPEQGAAVPSLIETTAVEERLGIFFTENQLVPEYSRLLYFVHHTEMPK
jgi:cobalamin-dependent methionine synthase I